MADERSTTRWLAVTVRSPSSEIVHSLAEGLMASGATAVQEEGPLLQTYFPAPADPETFLAGLRRTLGECAGAHAIEVTAEWHAHKDWSALWRQGLQPRRVGRHMIVTPGWCKVDPAEDDIVLTVEPAMGFGTGEHASTRGVLRLLEDAIRPQSRVLDVGTGSAILAVAAVKLGAGHVDAIDSDPDALESARETLAQNAATEQVDLRLATIDAEWLEAAALSYDLILANVLSGTLTPLLTSFHTALASDGALILAGILDQEADVMIRAAADARLVLRAEDREEGWWAGLFTTAF